MSKQTIAQLVQSALSAARRERASEDVIVPLEKALDDLIRAGLDSSGRM